MKSILGSSRGVPALTQRLPPKVPLKRFLGGLRVFGGGIEASGFPRFFGEKMPLHAV